MKRKFGGLKKLLCYAAAALVCAAALSGLKLGDVEEYAVVHAVGIDKADVGFRVSFQIFRVASSGSLTPVDSSKTNVEIVSSEGETIDSTVSQCERQLGKRMFFGHNRLLVISEELGEIYPCLDYFAKKNDAYIGMTVGVCEQSAEDILNCDISSGTIAAETMERVFEVAYEQGESVEYDFMKLVADYIDSGSSAALPIVEKRTQAIANKSKESGEPAQDALTVSRAAIVKGGSFAGCIDADEVLGISFFRSSVDDADLTLDIDGAPQSVKAKSISSSCSLSVTDGGAALQKNLTVKLTCDTQVTSEERDKLTAAAEKKLGEHIKSAVDAALKEYSADILGLSRLIRQRDYNEYLEFREDPISYLSRLTVNVSVKAVF